MLVNAFTCCAQLGSTVKSVGSLDLRQDPRARTPAAAMGYKPLAPNVSRSAGVSSAGPSSDEADSERLPLIPTDLPKREHRSRRPDGQEAGWGALLT